MADPVRAHPVGSHPAGAHPVRIVFLDDAMYSLDGDVDFSGIAAQGDYARHADSTPEEAVERGRGAHVLITNKAKVTAAAIEAGRGLRLVAAAATGYDNVDVRAAAARGVAVCNVPGYAEHTVPQHAFALILNLATQAYRYAADVRAGDWAKADGFTLLRYPTFELHGKTIGIIGFGAIGRGVARIACGFGMRVIAHDALGIADGAYANTPIDELLSAADVVTVHTPLNDATRNLIDAGAIALMKRSALLINTARGGIVDEEALAEALNRGRLAGAGFDVLTGEPPRDGNPLLTARNALITPHSAWSTREARQNLITRTAENIRAFLSGAPRNLVS